MMREEFEARFGMEVTPVVYDRIEELYMQGNEDKDTFVRRVKRQGIVMKIQSEIIAEMSNRIHEAECYLTSAKAEADATYHRYCDVDGDKRKDYEAARDLLVEGSREYYAYNNGLMSLERSTIYSSMLERLTGNKSN